MMKVSTMNLRFVWYVWVGECVTACVYVCGLGVKIHVCVCACLFMSERVCNYFFRSVSAD